MPNLNYQTKSKLNTTCSLLTSRTGFTLVELMVVVSILAVLSIIGVNVFKGTGKSADDTKRKGDIDAIASAYEANYDANAKTYRGLTPEDFTGGSVPVPPEGGSYMFEEGPGLTGAISARMASTQTYRICAVLAGGSVSDCTSALGSDQCYCRISSRGPVPASALTITPTRIPTLTPIPDSAPGVETPAPVPTCANTVYSCVCDGAGYVLSDYDCSTSLRDCAYRWPSGCTPP